MDYKVDILAFGAHPDDVELSCAGTLIKHIKLGFTVAIVDLTRGELGTRGNAALRDKEAAEAAKIMGVKYRENLDMRDGFFVNDDEHQLAVARMIRKYKPRVVFCNAVTDRHPDHGKGSKLVSDACFMAGLIKAKTEQDGVEQTAHRPVAVYHYIQDRYTKPDILVDISDVMEQRMQTIKAYASQFYNPDSVEPGTAISSKEFMQMLESRPAEWGRSIGVKYGEGFTVERLIGVKNIFDLL
ncbi:MAG TPA: bacillithiol biosynthesis deacetylase BshB1 [Bacteroidia bacterium]|nr:bacillithiol biosynthesis deacetylase BshB1 [Bacteroidia bacterium]HNU34601.1 bacillithiol biosynthesis deacetylase BshB1 [Bacteroidia bacterium]